MFKNFAIIALSILGATSAAAQTTKVTIIWGDTTTFGAEGAYAPLNDPFTELVLPSRVTTPIDTQITGLNGFYEIEPVTTMGSDFSNNFFGNLSLTEGMAYVSSRFGEGSDRLIINISTVATDCDPDNFWDATIWDQPRLRDGVTDNNWEGRQETVQAELAAVFANSPGQYVIDSVVFSAFTFGDNWTSASEGQTQSLATCDLLTGIADALPNVTTSPLCVRKPIRRWVTTNPTSIPNAFFNASVCSQWTGDDSPVDLSYINPVYLAPDGLNLNSNGLWLAGIATGVAIY
jgi:hypothetical protein